MIYLFSPQYFQYDVSSLYCSLLESGRTRPLEHHCRLSLSQHRHVRVSKTVGKKVFIYGLYIECFNLEESMVALDIGLILHYDFLSQRPL